MATKAPSATNSDVRSISRETRLELLWEMHLRGYSRARMARDLGVSRAQIYYDLADLLKKNQLEQVSDGYAAKHAAAIAFYQRQIAEQEQALDKIGPGDKNAPAYRANILANRQRVDTLQGLDAPERTSVATIQEIETAVLQALRIVGDEELSAGGAQRLIQKFHAVLKTILDGGQSNGGAVTRALVVSEAHEAQVSPAATVDAVEAE